MAEALVAAAGDGLVVIDRQGKIVVFNAAAGQIFDQIPGDMIGKNLDALIVPNMFVEHHRYVVDFFEGGGRGVVGNTIESVARRRDGSAIPVEISLSTTTVGTEPLVLASIRDITKRRQSEERNRQLIEQLTQAQKMEALGTLAAGIAHDFNNMLGAIMGYASAMTRELDGHHRHFKDAEQILLVARRAKRLTDNLLAFARHSDFNAEVFSVNRVIRDVVGLLSRTIPKSIVIKTRLLRGLNTESDRTQLEQALLNLCLNSRDAMPDGGELLIQTQQVQLSAAEARPLGVDEGKFNEIVVTDNGVGMDPQTLKRVFDPFFSTKPTGEGSGLGLSLVYNTVKHQGGQVQITSEAGTGTTVTLYLPATDSQPTARVNDAAQGAMQLRGNGELILLVDDEMHLREMAKRLLDGLGYKVLLAESGEEAEALFRQHHSSIDLVILDVVLVGLSGMETLKRLKVINPDVRVLVSSGHSPEGEPKHLLQQGVCGFIQKPYGIEEVSQAIHWALRWTPAT